MTYANEWRDFEVLSLKYAIREYSKCRNHLALWISCNDVDNFRTKFVIPAHVSFVNVTPLLRQLEISSHFAFTKTI